MPTITKRSIVAKQRTLVITVPKAWSDYNECKKGDPVGVSINGDLHITLKPESNENTLRLISVGGQFIISLPSEWVRAHNLKKGDKVEVIANGELIVRPVKISAVKT